MNLHHKYMTLAIEVSKNALKSGDIPVGAVIVQNDTIVCSAHNTIEHDNNPINHAEIIAINLASQILGDKHLTDCDMYVTLEPCVMCAGAIILARMRRIIFGAYDSKTGACGSLFSILYESKLNHKVEVIGGIMEAECSLHLMKFFENIRKNKNA